MKRGIWLIFAALAIAAAALPFRYDPAPVAALESTPAPPERSAPVRVSHEFVTVEIPAPAAHGARPPGVTRLQTVLANGSGSESLGRREVVKAVHRDAGPTTRHAARDQNLLERAGRAFVGDGKYRPEPFPRIK